MEHLYLFLFDDQPINFNWLGELVNDLAQPVLIHENGRNEVARNEDFYELTIPMYNGDLFKEHFRMSRVAFEELIPVVAHAMPEMLHKIPLEKKLLFSIWVISKPESFLAAGDRFGLARSTAHNIFKEIVAVISSLVVNYIRWPLDHTPVIQTFNERYHIPGVIGAIDGCHIEIKQPTENANDYYNRNSYHSIILQGICDHTLKFIDVFIGIPGRVHDARVFRNSAIYDHIHSMPRNLHLLADSAYPLAINVMTPFRDNGHLNATQVNFNNIHSSARAVIERAFGRLKGKFRRLKYLDISTPDFGCQIISAACVLHNFIIIQDGIQEDFEPDLGVPNEVLDNDLEANRNVAEGKRMEIAELLL